jgi:hypothetical protein
VTDRERERRAAVAQLLARPDRDDARRTHHRTQDGNPNRFERWQRDETPRVHARRYNPDEE